MYKSVFRPLFFNFDSEQIHNLIIRSAKLFNLGIASAAMRKFTELEDPRLRTTVCGIEFDNPIGLAAGFDKNLEAFNFLDALGFGFIEIGTVVPKAQPGNVKPRIFRLPADKAIINRMGFPSHGSDIIRERLTKINLSRARTVLALNIGKNKETPIEKSVDDYRQVFSSLGFGARFIVVNVSSPNTPDLRKLQEKSRLSELLKALQEINTEKKPLLVKIAPDLSEGQIEDVLQAAVDAGISGIIATNTTFSRDGISRPVDQEGGLSGKPLFERAKKIVNFISRRTEKKLPIIAVGGIFNSADAIQMLQAGASLLEVYTGFIYEGPFIAYNLKRGLLRYMEENKISTIEKIVSG